MFDLNHIGHIVLKNIEKTPPQTPKGALRYLHRETLARSDKVPFRGFRGEKGFKGEKGYLLRLSFAVGFNRRTGNVEKNNWL
jgi:hypothetical protein